MERPAARRGALDRLRAVPVDPNRYLKLRRIATENLAALVYGTRSAPRLHQLEAVANTSADRFECLDVIPPVAAMKATLESVLTDESWPAMIDLATKFREGVEAAIAEFDLPWTCTQLGARAEYRFASPAPVCGTESAESADTELEEYFHLYTANRGVLITPFHNMALMCRDTSAADVDLHTELFRAACADLRGKA